VGRTLLSAAFDVRSVLEARNKTVSSSLLYIQGVSGTARGEVLPSRPACSKWCALRRGSSLLSAPASLALCWSTPQSPWAAAAWVAVVALEAAVPWVAAPVRASSAFVALEGRPAPAPAEAHPVPWAVGEPAASSAFAEALAVVALWAAAKKRTSCPRLHALRSRPYPDHAAAAAEAAPLPPASARLLAQLRAQAASG